MGNELKQSENIFKFKHTKYKFYLETGPTLASEIHHYKLTKNLLTVMVGYHGDQLYTLQKDGLYSEFKKQFKKKFLNLFKTRHKGDYPKGSISEIKWNCVSLRNIDRCDAEETSNLVYEMQQYLDKVMKDNGIIYELTQHEKYWKDKKES